MTVETLQARLHEMDDGVLRNGSHQPGRKFCAIEFESLVRGREWSDQPLTLPDLRPLNDGPWSSDEARTAALLPVMAALWDWSKWTAKRRQQWAVIVQIQTVRQIIAELPGLPTAIKKQCREAVSLEEARDAAYAAADAAARAADVADAAARAADVADAAARAAAADEVLQVACSLWVKAAKESRGYRRPDFYGR